MYGRIAQGIHKKLKGASRLTGWSDLVMQMLTLRPLKRDNLQNSVGIEALDSQMICVWYGSYDLKAFWSWRTKPGLISWKPSQTYVGLRLRAPRWKVWTFFDGACCRKDRNRIVILHDPFSDLDEEFCAVFHTCGEQGPGLV